MSDFMQALRAGPVLLMDGAMGTELQRAGIGKGECYEAWNLSHPDKVEAIHRKYAHAGADVLLTNTFQANREALGRHGLQDRLHDIFRAGIQIARQAHPNGFILADIGPPSSRDPSWSSGLSDAIAGADAVLLETFAEPELAIRLLHELAVPALTSFTYHRDRASRTLLTLSSVSPQTCARHARDLGAAAIGVNCGVSVGLEELLEILQAYRESTDLPLFVRPNAGTPEQLDGTFVYPRNPSELASWVPRLLHAGIRMIGGCCGATPEHITALRVALDENAVPDPGVT